MVDKVIAGVLGIQGDVSEHINLMNNAFKETKTPGQTIIVNQKKDIDSVDGLIIPGGESSTISKMLLKSGLYDPIRNRLDDKDLALMGTCAGCILLAKKIVNNDVDVKLLNAIDIQVERNAFGRQKESFEKNIDINGFSKPYHAVFIRAPVITKVWNDCKVLSKIENKIIVARQENVLALSFHPELTDDVRIHKYFLDII